jgi:hypothetical protein
VVKKKRKILENCPTCGDDLEITQLKCCSCETSISARYTPCRFCKLSPESLQLVEIFIKCRGNVKEMERELGLSYPTVRARLDGAIKELGFAIEPTESDRRKEERRQVLERLEAGQIKATDAAELLAKIK